ncbi:MAG: hypothetical protein AAF433_05025 [Bacteroidota bacterium]
MSWITSVKRWKFRRELEQLLSTQQPHQSQAHNLLTVKRLCVLFPADASKDRRRLDTFKSERRKEGLRTELFGFVNERSAPEGGSFPLYSKADLNWYGTPKEEMRKRFTEKYCDALLVLGKPDHELFNFLAQLKNCGLRVGPFSEAADNPFDVLYDPGTGGDLSEQLKTVTTIFQIANAPATVTV